MFKTILGPTFSKILKKKGWPRMVLTYDLPNPPILQKEAFLAQKKGVYDLPFLAKKNKGRS